MVIFNSTFFNLFPDFMFRFFSYNSSSEQQYTSGFQETLNVYVDQLLLSTFSAEFYTRQLFQCYLVTIGFVSLRNIPITEWEIWVEVF
jgi:hypothetical protein